MPRLRVQVGGALASTGRWSVTHEYALSGPVPNLSVLQTVANALQTFFLGTNGLRSNICTDTTIVAPKLLHYLDGATTANLVAEGAGAASSGLLTPVHAPQVCVVASLRTDAAGRSKRGRSYIPVRHSAIGANGVVSGSGQSSARDAVFAIRQGVLASLAAQGITGSWIVWSRTLSSGLPVTAVYVGNQCDTIRHRNANRDEVYSTAPVPPVALALTGDADLDEIAARFAAGARVKPLGEQDPGLPDFWDALYNLIPVGP